MNSDYLTYRRELKLKDKPGPVKRVLSKKRAKKQREYRKLVYAILSKDDRCKIKSPVCTGKAQGLHHVVKRSEKNLCNKNILIPSCNACNGWIEQNSEKAKQLRLTKSKFTE